MKNAQNSLLHLSDIRKTLQGIYQEKQKLAKLTLARYQSYKNAQENTLGCVSRKTKINEATIKNALARQLVNKL